MLQRSRRRRRAALRRHAVLTGVCLLVVLVLTGPRHDGPAQPPWADARGASRQLSGPMLTAYPWPDETDLAARDPWGFPKRQCTSYVAWYLNTHGIPFSRLTRGPAGTGDFGDADNWTAAARVAGFTVSGTPAVGTIAQWSAGEDSAPGLQPSSPTVTDVVEGVFEAGGKGHVAVVFSVHADGTVDVAEYNGRTRRFETRIDRAPRYLYIGVPGPPAGTGAPPSGSPAWRSPSPICVAGC